MPKGYFQRSEDTKAFLRSLRKGLVPWNKGRAWTIVEKAKIGAGRKGKAGCIHTDEFKERVRQRVLIDNPAKHPEIRLKMSEAQSGAKHWKWQGGITPINTKIRFSQECKDWRFAVFVRDNFACVWCGVKGKRLNADHIKPFALYPELRFELSNGRTLCVSCHKNTDTYGVKRRTA